MKRSRRMTPVLAAATALLLACAGWAQAQVLQQVPADALVVIKFNKLKATSGKLGGLAKKLGLTEMDASFVDPLAQIKQKAKIQNGLDDAGDAAMVVTNLAGANLKEEPPMLLLLPVTDYKAFLGNFADAKTEGDVTSFQFGGEAKESYSANWGKYAAISTSKELLSKKPEGLTPKGAAAKELDEKDICAYVNMDSARALILPKIQGARQKFISLMEQGYKMQMQNAGGAATQPANPLPIVEAIFGRVFDVFQQAVTDAQSASYGLSFSDEGMKTTSLLDFTAGSPSAQHVAMLKPSDREALTGLPQLKYIFFGGMTGDTKNAQQFLSDFVDPINKQIAGAGPDAKPIQTYLEAIKSAIGASTGASFGWVAPSGALGQEAIFQMVSINNGNADAMLKAQRDIFNSQQAFMDLFQPPQLKGQITTTYKANAKTVDGVQLNEFTTQFGPPAGGQPTPQQMQMQQMMAMMYGPNGMNGYAGAIGNDKMIGAVGVTDNTLEMLVAAAKANKNVIGEQPSIQSVKQQLPKSRLFEGYFAVDTLASTVANYARMFMGGNMNLQLPQNLPPVGFSLTTDGSAIRAEGYVPAQLVQSMTAAIMQLKMQMQGGPGGGAGGGPGGPGGL